MGLTDQEKLRALRKQIKNHKLGGFLIPISDEFQGEYIPGCAKRLEFLTGFTGSAGLAAVLPNKAAFFTDGRYTLQAKSELNNKLYQIYNIAEKRPEEWIGENIKGALGIDSLLHTKSAYERYLSYYIKLKNTENLVDLIWVKKPESPKDPVVIHPLKYAGKSSTKKRREISNAIKKKGADIAIITAPDSICWLLNIRGNDVPHTPIVRCYAFLDNKGKVNIFADPGKFDKKVRAYLGKDITINNFKDLPKKIAALKGKKIMIDPDNAAVWFFINLEKSRAEIIKSQDPCQLPKACKNEVELQGMREAHKRDGRALVKFLEWLKEGDNITEISAAEKLYEFRKENTHFRDLSFTTISGYGSNGAIVHYRVTPKTNKKLENGGLYLIDSGAQYLDGTTDITRTVAIGTPTNEMKEHFTRVLKGHIAIATAMFPVGTTGAQLDVLARNALWQAGLDYDHGTGHGVGSYLGVHEGPQYISKRGSNTPLMPGMIISNEPGVYIAGKYGIRIENLVVVRESSIPKFLEFETITLVPIDTSLIDPSMLTKNEIDWLDNYHEMVVKNL